MKTVHPTQIFDYVPAKFNFAACDSDGEWYLFEDAPRVEELQLVTGTVKLWVNDNELGIALDEVTDIQITTQKSPVVVAVKVAE